MPRGSGDDRTIRYSKRSYGYARVCYALPVPRTRFAPARALPMRRLAPRSTYWTGVRRFFPRQRDLVHTFNDLVIGARAWIVSHELELPRFLRTVPPDQLARAYGLLASPRCVRILSMSAAARAWLMRRVPADIADVIAEKTQLFTGGVNGPEHFALESGLNERTRSAPLRLIYVGNNAFRKGGTYVLDAFDRLRAGGLHVELAFVGRVEARSYVLRVDQDAYDKLVRRLSNTPGVRWIRQATNREVLAEMTQSHIGLLPTLDDSLGWSVIEMMSARLPVIASNIVALPEMITEGVNGRLIDLPRDADNRWVGVVQRHGDVSVAEDAHARLVGGVVACVCALAADDDLRMRMGAAGRARYLERYTPELAGETLGKIYDEVCAAVGSRG